MGFESMPGGKRKEMTERTCPSCNGKKTDSNGEKCKSCNGRGKMRDS